MATGIGVLAPGVTGLYNGGGSIVGVQGPNQSTPNGLTTGVPVPTDQSGPLTGGNSGGNGSSAYAPQIGSLDAQTAALQGTLGTADHALSSGLANLLSQYTQQKNAATTNHNNAVTDFNTTTQNDNLNHGQAIDQVNTKARTLANSVRQMIGNASGSGSSAYQLAAPDAVQRQADLQSQDINNSFGQNMQALTTAKQREDQAYEGPTGLLAQLADKYTQSQNSLQTGIDTQKQQINGQLADIAAQRAAYAGGGTAGAAAAAAPYNANVAQYTTAINNIADSYKSPFDSIAPVQVAAPTLRDYVTGQTNVATNPTGTQTQDTPTYNPLSIFKNQDQNQNQYAF